VDANILIFERIKEEFARGRSTHDAMHEGFARAWPAIRDSNIAHIITASILFFMGTSLIQGFALVFGLGVIVSMLSAITISRNFLYAVSITHNTAFGRFMLDSGFVNSKKS
jgi:protein-export membrane protein SecD